MAALSFVRSVPGASEVLVMATPATPNGTASASALTLVADTIGAGFGIPDGRLLLKVRLPIRLGDAVATRAAVATVGRAFELAGLDDWMLAAIPFAEALDLEGNPGRFEGARGPVRDPREERRSIPNAPSQDVPARPIVDTRAGMRVDAHAIPSPS